MEKLRHAQSLEPGPNHVLEAVTFPWSRMVKKMGRCKKQRPSGEMLSSAKQWRVHLGSCQRARRGTAVYPTSAQYNRPTASFGQEQSRAGTGSSTGRAPLISLQTFTYCHMTF